MAGELDVYVLWCQWLNAPYPVLDTEHKPSAIDPAGDELAEQLWRNPLDKFPR